MTETISLFIRQLNEHSIEIADRQLEQFELYYRELVDWNEKMNLTSITEREQVYVKHFFDSITLAFYVPVDRIVSLADIGSGAGFPSIPLKIMFPHLKITIVDSLKKRIGFLEALTGKLQLTDVNCIHGRAEEVARQGEHREAYEMVTARAVARLSVLAELCLPFARVGGVFAAMKGSDPAEELKEAEYAIRRLGGKTVSDFAFSLPTDGSSRHIIMVDKVKATPDIYPRKPGIPLKAPLVAPGNQ